MENRQCSTAVHTALTLVVAALLTICVAPVVHLATPTDGWLDLAAARALDGVDSVMPGELWLSNALKGTGATLFNPGGWHGPQTWTTSGSPTAGFFEVHLAPGRTFSVHRARGSFPDEHFHIVPTAGLVLQVCNSFEANIRTDPRRDLQQDQREHVCIHHLCQPSSREHC